ncbi:MAG: response regulator [Xanthobacteraceae bacterium]
MRFFFDYTTTDQSLRDYQGDEFLSSKGAFDFAAATAQTLRSSLNGEWAGWSVEVRDANGTKYFSLPIMPGQPATTELNAEPVQSVKNPSTVLIIEDMPVHGVIIGHIARKVGFVTTEAHSYEDACKIVDARQFDCITLDLGLGEHVGLDVLRYLSTIRCKAQIIVISQSDKDVCDDMVELGRALELNVCDCVPKPMDLDALRETFVRIRAHSLPQTPALSGLIPSSGQ